MASCLHFPIQATTGHQTEFSARYSMFVLVTLYAPSHFSRVQLWPSGLRPARLLCPWDSPGKNTGVGCHALFQGIFQTQGSNSHLLRLLHWQADFFVFSFSSPPSHLGSPVYCIYSINSEYASVPISQFLLPSLSHLVFIHLLSTSVCLFLLCK